MNRIAFTTARAARVVLLSLPFVFAACGGIVPAGTGAGDGSGSGLGSGTGSGGAKGVPPVAVDGGVITEPGQPPTPCNCPASDKTCTCSGQGSTPTPPLGADDAGVPAPTPPIVDDAGVPLPPSGDCKPGDPTCGLGPDAGIGPTPPVCPCPANDPKCPCVDPTDAGLWPPPPPPPPPVCDCPASDPTCVCVGPDDAGVVPIPPCPPGWLPPKGDPTVCCIDTGAGGIACFDNSAPAVPTPVPPTADDAGLVPVPPGVKFVRLL